ncbi:MAG: TetR/AcrR family transcriptional regulator [Gaiellaceae bacterium]
MASESGAHGEEPSARGGARARIVDTAYELFSREGVRAVGIDRVIAEARVAKMTLYRHFASKDALVLAFLEERGRRWTRGWLFAGVEARASRPQDRLLAVFDLLDEWFARPDYDGCSLTRTLYEIPSDPIHAETVHQLELVRRTLAAYAAEAGVSDPDAFAYVFHSLMLGAMVSALRGDLSAAKRARVAAALLLDAAQ